MTNETITQQLFKLTTQIQLFDKENYQQRMLDEVARIYHFEAAMMLNVRDDHQIELTFFSSE